MNDEPQSFEGQSMKSSPTCRTVSFLSFSRSFSMNTIHFNWTLNNYIVCFADGTELACANKQTALYYARTLTSAPE